MDYVKCPACGWVRYAVKRGAAQLDVVRFNSYAQRVGLKQGSSLESYMTCLKCGADTTTFERFTPEREPGHTMQPVVVEQ